VSLSDRTAHLEYQYGTPRSYASLRDARALQRVSGDWVDWMLPTSRAPGAVLSTPACGPGSYHEKLLARGVHIARWTIAGHGARRCTRTPRASESRCGVMRRRECVALATTAFDRVMANHMMYYVDENQRGVLRAMRELLRPGGRVVLATNAAENLARLRSCTRGQRPSWATGSSPRDASSFTLEHLPLVRSVFPSRSLRRPMRLSSRTRSRRCDTTPAAWLIRSSPCLRTAATSAPLIAARWGAMIDESSRRRGCSVSEGRVASSLWSDPLHAPDDDDGRAAIVTSKQHRQPDDDRHGCVRRAVPEDDDADGLPSPPSADRACSVERASTSPRWCVRHPTEPRQRSPARAQS